MDLINLEKLQIKEDGLNPCLVCKDGFWLSVQGGRGAYSEPRDKEANIYGYHSMEIRDSDVLPQEFSQYQDGEGSRIYGYVPVEMIENLLASNGGV